MNDTSKLSNEKHTYGQILRSSVLIGGSTVASVAIRIVRTKAMAVFVGPAGVGLLSIYESITTLVQSIAGLGISGSGVRQIAEAAGTGETERIARTVVVLRRTSIILGLLGALFLALFSRMVSIMTFGNDQYAGSVAILSLVVFFGLVSGGQSALIQGMRRISDLAWMGILGTLLGTIITIPTIYFFREKGIVPSLVGIAAMSIATSWWYSRKLQIKPPAMTYRQMRQETVPLLKLGVAFMASGFFTTGGVYVVRMIVLRHIGIDAAGLYQSAWGIGGLYVGFILQAMGADFYPRLTAVANKNEECNRLVNEQALVSLLLAGPGVIATLTFAQAVISIFYSVKFGPAVEILRWICLGMTLRVITWPMGFILVAKGKQNLFMMTDFAWAVVNIALAWICVTMFGLKGAGIAFFGSCVSHGFLLYPIVRHQSGFRWSSNNRRTGIFLLFLIGVVFCCFYLVSFWPATVIGTLVTLGTGMYSVRVLVALISPERIPGPIRLLLTQLRLLR
ncbi:MAG: O-antigen translocase [Syntrophobacterales bacterium]|nr:O-antigen translocase [Syntrophobacterales bacterium]